MVDAVTIEAPIAGGTFIGTAMVRLNLAMAAAARTRAEAQAMRAVHSSGRGRPAKPWCPILAGELAALFRATTGRSPATEGGGGAEWVRALMRNIHATTEDVAVKHVAAELLSLSDATVSTYLRKADGRARQAARIFFS